MIHALPDYDEQLRIAALNQIAWWRLINTATL